MTKEATLTKLLKELRSKHDDCTGEQDCTLQMLHDAYHLGALRQAGCVCIEPLLGIRPPYHFRCRLCNTEENV